MISPEPDGGPFPAIRAAAAAFRTRLLHVPGLRREEDPAAGIEGIAGPLRWHNLIGAAPAFRRAHVELLEVPGRLIVLHCCIVPHLDDASPVFGFDVVAGPARVTGLFLDLSPVLPGAPVPRLGTLAGFAERRARPEWGDIFSEDFLAIRPADAAELTRAVLVAGAACEAMLARLVGGHGRGADVAQVRAGQAHYVAGQRRNPHTQRMLAGLVGAGPAARFIEEALFPEPPEVEWRAGAGLSPAPGSCRQHPWAPPHTTTYDCLLCIDNFCFK